MHGIINKVLKIDREEFSKNFCGEKFLGDQSII